MASRGDGSGTPPRLPARRCRSPRGSRGTGGFRTARCPCHAGGARAPRGFTLVEIMVVIAVIGLAMSVIFSGSKSLLPQTRLRATAREMGSALEQARTQAVLVQEPILFAYDIEHGGYESYYPYERDDKGDAIGPGRTPVQDFTRLREGVALRKVRLPGSAVRDMGVVTLTISPLGRIPPHEVVLYNPDYPDTEVVTLRVSGLANRTAVLEGDDVMPAPEDVDFH
ncbi:MAG TPA: prepilin-type N-terminal cleavage/methylation domain-containing protein [Planctomycetota bacterium]|nr:prepilin-type N-terminal cleavage/methylation domain-containing protein [Planctomycetota bacterium]